MRMTPSVVLVNFEHITPYPSVSIVNFEHVIAGWVGPYESSFKHFVSKAIKYFRKNLCHIGLTGSPKYVSVFFSTEVDGNSIFV